MGQGSSQIDWSKAGKRLRRTKAGREIVDQHREAFLHVLCDAVGKP